MKVKDLRKLMAPDGVLWIQDSLGYCLDANENRYLPAEYDEREVVKLETENYRSILSIGLTVTVK